MMTLSVSNDIQSFLSLGGLNAILIEVLHELLEHTKLQAELEGAPLEASLLTLSESTPEPSGMKTK